MAKLLLWFSAGLMFLSLGLFSPAFTEQPTASVGAVTAPASAELLPTAAPPVAPATSSDGTQCAAQPGDAPSPLLPPTVQAACPTGTAFTCCRCGGCGCRPQNISPTNWCAC